MFTGIIEELGTVKSFLQTGSNAKITIECKEILNGVKIGDSIAIDGACQTVVAFSKNTFSAEVSGETLKVTTFSKLKTGTIVNLERAMTLNSRLGGHIVSGHVDGLGQIKTIQKTDDFYRITISFEEDIAKYLAKKGSVTINGISLTIADIKMTEFELAIIPHTFETTNLKYLQNGNFVNLEVDILARYIEKILSTGNNGCKNVIDESFLKQNGFF